MDNQAPPKHDGKIRQPVVSQFGTTSLEACMRAKVASVYGDEVPDISEAA